jgi:hypothetical protein
MTRMNGLFIRHGALRDYRTVKLFVAAAEAMIEPDTDRRAAALIYGARALMLVAEGDPDERALKVAEDAVRDLAKAREGT